MTSSSVPHVLLLCTGSVAAIKIPLLRKLVLTRGYEVRVVATESAQKFLEKVATKDEFIPEVLTDKDEWELWESIGSPVLHIELCRWADIAILAPLDANTLAKLASGICDNLVTCILRAWNMDKPVILAPAMNTCMWTHPCTQEHLSKLRFFFGLHATCEVSSLAPLSADIDISLETSAILEGISFSWEEGMNKEVQGVSTKLPSDCSVIIYKKNYPIYAEVGPISKMLACGDFGIGGMASPYDIASILDFILSQLS